MNVDGVRYRTIWVKPGNERVIQVIDQRFLPHRFVVEDLKSVEEAARAIEEMHVRGAPLIGVTAAYGMYLAGLEGKGLEEAAARLRATRPTAVNLEFALKKVFEATEGSRTRDEKVRRAFTAASALSDEDERNCEKIGTHGLKLIEEISGRKKGEVVNILTHCNAGWLACVDWGTATAPIYQAFDRGVKVHVFIGETRPRNQGASLTAWELRQHRVPHTVIVDSAAGHLMQRGMVDLVLVGTDRTTATGDVANKIGTYLYALAARDNGIPFYVALPSSSIDWELQDGIREIPIERRGEEEVTHIRGLLEGKIVQVRLTPTDTPAANYAFDVTPRRLVTGLITERGISPPNRESLLTLFPEAEVPGTKSARHQKCLAPKVPGTFGDSRD